MVNCLNPLSPNIQVQILQTEAHLFIYLFIYQLFWTRACPEGMIVHERDSRSMRGAIPTQSHNS